MVVMGKGGWRYRRKRKGDRKVQISIYKISFGGIMYSIEIRAKNVLITIQWHIVMAYYGEHFVRYINVESLCCTPDNKHNIECQL